MIFNGIEKDYITVMRGRERPFFAVEDERNIEVPVFIKHNGFSHYERLKEDIAYWLKHEEPKPLEFRDDPDRVYFARVTDIDTTNTHPMGSDALIHFLSESKYSLERQLNINNELTSNIEGHKATAWKTKTIFAINRTGYEIQFNSPSKTSLRDIGKIKLNYNFSAGDILEIDYSKRLVKLNGKDITNTLVILQSNFMELPIDTVEFKSSDETNFYYHERYY